jgi:hypothetical protein
LNRLTKHGKVAIDLRSLRPLLNAIVGNDCNSRKDANDNNHDQELDDCEA